MRLPKLRWVICAAVVSFLFVVFATNCADSFAKIRELGAKLDTSMNELEKLKRETQQLEHQLENARTGASIEKEAREKYDLLKPGEKIYRIKTREEREPQ